MMEVGLLVRRPEGLQKAFRLEALCLQHARIIKVSYGFLGLSVI